MIVSGGLGTHSGAEQRIEIPLIWGLALKKDEIQQMSVTKAKGRQAEVVRIRRANRAVAVGNLMLGKLSDWGTFLDADTRDLAALPRRQLKSGSSDVKKRLLKEIDSFTGKNFIDMTSDKLASLYEEIAAHRGFEIPLDDFERKYARVRPQVVKGYPPHCTMVFSYPFRGYVGHLLTI